MPSLSDVFLLKILNVLSASRLLIPLVSSHRVSVYEVYVFNPVPHYNESNF
jgi:hypothetical protein